MKKFNYDSLKNIERPVMLIVDDSIYTFDKKSYRIRILFPDGTCIYNTKHSLIFEDLDYYYSCFLLKNSKGNHTAYQDLKRTVLRMKNYDSRQGLKIKKVIKL